MIKDFKKLLSEFVAIPSVSADRAYEKDIQRAVLWISTYLKSAGMQVKIIKGYGNPVVIARTKKDPSKETVLIYGHYDVQPASKKDGWASDPFVLTEKNKKSYARGVADNKGQILTHMYSVCNLLQESKLAYNVIFLIEGNEETGSSKFKNFLRDNKKELVCDCVIISDGDLSKNDTPAIEASFRGVANVEVILRTAQDDMHSGLFGGVVPNASQELSRLISLLRGQDQRVIVPGFYDGIKQQKKLEDRIGLEPALEVTSFTSGYQGQGFRNSIPATASVKINIRSAPMQDPVRLVKLLKKFLLKQATHYVSLEIKIDETAFGAVLETNNEITKKIKQILKKVYKKSPEAKHSGGTLPIVNDLKRVLGVPQIMAPLANNDCGMHSASENLSISAIEKGLAFSREFFGMKN